MIDLSKKNIIDISNKTNFIKDIEGKHIKDIENLRKAIIFYNAIGGDMDILNDDIFLRMDEISKMDIDRQLRPMLIKNMVLDISEMKEKVKLYIKNVFDFTSDEKEFIEKWKENEFCPEKLFSNNEKLIMHPMALYRMSKNKER